MTKYNLYKYIFDDLDQELLKEIASLFITVRGHSKAHMVKEEYKNAKATATKGKRSLRKELKRQDAASEKTKKISYVHYFITS